MRDYSNMPRLEWQDDKATLAKIKTQIMREEPVILIMPQAFNFKLDASALSCEESSGLLLNCAPGDTFSALATQNSDTMLADVGAAAEVAGLTVDVDVDNCCLIIHD